MASRAELEQLAKDFANRADRLIAELQVDVSGATTWTMYSPAFQLIANAYERLDVANKKADQVEWARKSVDGWNGQELKQRVYDIRKELQRLDAAPP